MDKKNTLLLTVVAVATLLVAVVGATFAYFSIGATGTSNTNIRVGAQNVGTFTLAIAGDHPHLTLNASDMTKTAAGEKGKTYYSTISSGSGYEATVIEHNLAKATLTGGSADVKYTCTASISVSLTNTAEKTFEEGEGKIHLEGDTGVTLTGFDQDIDFTDLSENAKTGSATFNFTGNGTTVDKYIKGHLEFKNTATDQTSRLNGFEVTAQIDVGSFSCNATS